MTISRWRACASHGLRPLFVTSTQNCPASTEARPLPGTVNDVVQGTYLPLAKSTFGRRSWPESLGTSRPGEPFVGAAVQSAASRTTAGGALGLGLGLAGVGAAGATQAGPAPASHASARAAARALVTAARCPRRGRRRGTP